MKKIGLIVLVMILAAFFILVDLGPGTDDYKEPNLVPTPDKDVQDNDDLDNPDGTYDDEYDYDDLIIGDYVEDHDDYAVQLLRDAIGVNYMTFFGSVSVGDEEVYGIGFTPLDAVYESEDGKMFFDAGFIPFDDDVTITDAMMEEGLEIIDLDSSDITYLFTIKPNPFRDHVVIDSCYITFGIDDNGIMLYNVEQIKYDPNSEEYKSALKSVCDTSIGSLFSYDEGRWLFDTFVGDFTGVHSSYISQSIDYDAVAAELNEMLRTQDINALENMVNSQRYYATEAINAFLLSFQEETFMGFKVADLIEISEEIDPDQFIRITGDSIEVLDLPPDPTSATGLMRWLTAAGCIILGAVAIGMMFIPGANVAVSMIAGGIIGAAMDAMSQVVMGASFDSIDFGRLLVSGFIGSLCAIPGISLVADSLIGGLGEGVYTLIQGGTLGDAVISFGSGVALGLGMGVLFKGIQKIIDVPNKFKSKETIQPKNKKVVGPDESELVQSLKNKILSKKAANSLKETGQTEKKIHFKDSIGSKIQIYKATKAYDLVVNNPKIKDEMVLNVLKEIKDKGPDSGYIVEGVRELGNSEHISYYITFKEPLTIKGTNNNLKIEHISINDTGMIHYHIKADGKGPDVINVMYKPITDEFNNLITTKIQIEIVDPNKFVTKDIKYLKEKTWYKMENAIVTERRLIVIDDGDPLSEENLKDIINKYADALTVVKDKGGDTVPIEKRTGHPLEQYASRWPTSDGELRQMFWTLKGKEGKWSGALKIKDLDSDKDYPTELGITNGSDLKKGTSYMVATRQSTTFA